MQIHQQSNQDVTMEENPLANAVVEAEKALETEQQENEEEAKIRELDEAIKELERQIEEEEKTTVVAGGEKKAREEAELRPEDVEMVDLEKKEKKQRKIKGKTSKYFGVSHIGKRWRAMFGGKYIGMADTEVEAAQMVNVFAIKQGAGPKNDVPKKSGASKKVTKAISKKVKKTKRAKRIVKRKK